MTLIVLLVGRQETVQAWRTQDGDTFVEAAENFYGLVYEQWTHERARRTFGEGLIPYDLVTALNQYGEVYEVNWGDGNNAGLFDANSVPPKIEVARRAIFHDAVEGAVFTVDEAEAFVSGHLNIIEDDELRELGKRAVSIELRIIAGTQKAEEQYRLL